jgi:hypothetical protein
MPDLLPPAGRDLAALLDQAIANLPPADLDGEHLVAAVVADPGGPHALRVALAELDAAQMEAAMRAAGDQFGAWLTDLGTTWAGVVRERARTTPGGGVAGDSDRDPAS